MARPRNRERAAGTLDEETDERAEAADAEAEEQKTPEQALAEKLELDRFVDQLRRKYH